MFRLRENKWLKYVIAPIFFIVLGISSPIRNAYTEFLETKPISEKTLLILKNNEYYFKHYSEKYFIPNTALKAAVGSEINRRIVVNKITDYFQDVFFASSICSEQLLNYSLSSRIKSRYLNIAAQDIGLGNIKFLTAVEILQKNKNELPLIKNNRDLVEYLLKENGNIHIAALVIKEGIDRFSPYFYTCDELTKSAILYSYYKEGNSFYYRYLINSKLKRPPIPDPKGLELIKKLNNKT